MDGSADNEEIPKQHNYTSTQLVKLHKWAYFASTAHADPCWRVHMLTSRSHGSAIKSAVIFQSVWYLAIISRRNSAQVKDTNNLSALPQICSAVASAFMEHDFLGQSPAHHQFAVIRRINVRFCDFVIYYQVWTLEVVKCVHQNPSTHLCLQCQQTKTCFPVPVSKWNGAATRIEGLMLSESHLI